MIKLVIADDEYFIRARLEKIISDNRTNIDIVSLCEDGEDVIKCLSLTKVDLLLMDIKMISVTGLEVAGYIFENKLKKIFEIKTENDHTYSKIVGIKYFAGTEEGEIEVWNILDKELYNSIKIADIKINYIEEDEEKFFIGLVDGTMIITDKDFKILRKEKVSDEEIQKICIIENEIYILVSDKRIIKYRMINK